MKKILTSAVLAVLLFSCNDKSGTGEFTLQGELKASANQKIFLEQIYFSAKQPEVLDTGEIKNGKFTLKAMAPEEGLFRIRTADGAYDIFINESRNITFSGTAVSQQPISGNFSGAANSSLKNLIKYSDSISLLIANKSRLLNEFTKAGISQTDSIFMATTQEFKTISNDFTTFSFAYADTAKSPIVSLFAATLAPVELSRFIEPLNKLTKRFPKHTGIAEALLYVKAQPLPAAATEAKPVSKPTIGMLAPELTMNDVDDKTFSLSQLRGKFVLIDFWASWCGPCRGENPNVVAAYNQFKDKNFTVLGVSLDENKQAWIDAIKEDKLNWKHISDLKKWSSAATALYGIEGIPYNVLVDPAGKIIATDLRGTDLQNKLKEILK